jgi:N-acetylglutamate synthase-like GNAT family acetyltransferase
MIRSIGHDEPLFAQMVASLNAANLPTSDLLEGDAVYFALDEGRAFGGLVFAGETALLRSMIVPGERWRGAGSELLVELAMQARARGVRELWLLTDTAEPFFARHEFHRVERASTPESIAQTRQFKELCPDSAAVMRRSMP